MGSRWCLVSIDLHRTVAITSVLLSTGFVILQPTLEFQASSRLPSARFAAVNLALRSRLFGAGLLAFSFRSSWGRVRGRFSHSCC